MPHIVRSFDEELKSLSGQVSEMAAIASGNVAKAAEALRNRDVVLAETVRESDKHVDALQAKIEDGVIMLIAKRQPLAVDLRETIAILKMSSDLERIGDLAKSNAKRVLAVSALPQPAGVGTTLELLANRVQEQLAKVVHAYEGRDKDLARRVWESDSDIDSIHTALFRELLTYMMESPRNITYCTHLLFCAKNLERIGDHATNIAEYVYFIVTGGTLPAGRPKGEGVEPATT